MKFFALLGAASAIRINPTGYIVPTNPNQNGGGVGNANAPSIPNGEPSYNTNYPNPHQAAGFCLFNTSQQIIYGSNTCTNGSRACRSEHEKAHQGNQHDGKGRKSCDPSKDVDAAAANPDGSF